MKKNMLSILFALPLALMAQQKYQISGHLSELKKETKVFLSYGGMGEVVRDSTISKNGIFTFSGTVDDPILATLSIQPTKNKEGKRGKPDLRSIFLENDLIKIVGKDSLAHATITNSPTTTAYEKYNSTIKGLTFKDAMDYQLNFIKKNPESPLSLNLLEELLFPVPADYNLLASLYKNLSAKNQNTKKGKKLSSSIEVLNDIAIGRQAPDILQFDTDGKPVKLSDMRGKYVLVDFWASWCKPCRAENPNLVKAYNKFKSKNFTIIGISIDKSKSAWLKAVAEDKLDWLQVAGEEGKENIAANTYHIMAIPQNFLLDANGKIIAKNLKGEDLIPYLEKLL